MKSLGHGPLPGVGLFSNLDDRRDRLRHLHGLGEFSDRTGKIFSMTLLA